LDSYFSNVLIPGLSNHTDAIRLPTTIERFTKMSALQKFCVLQAAFLEPPRISPVKLFLKIH